MSPITENKIQNQTGVGEMQSIKTVGNGSKLNILMNTGLCIEI